MFTKIARCDLYNGILMQWKKYLITFMIFCYFSVAFVLERRVVEYINPEILAGPATLGDFILYIFVGSESQPLGSFDITDGYLSFKLPTAWIIIFLWLLYITLYYPYEDLMGHGKHMLVLSKSRGMWWISKSLWAITSVITYFLTAALAISTVALLFGAEMSFSVSDYMPVDFIGQLDTLIAPPWSVTDIIAPLVLGGIALCMMELVMSLLFKPLYSYIIMCIYVFVCSYFKNIFLIGNYTMAARSAVFVTDGFYWKEGAIMCLWVISLSVFIGAVFFMRMDIINKD
jgi:hypothetical protein